MYRPDWEVEDRTPMDQRWTVNMLRDDRPLVFVGDPKAADAWVHIGGETFLAGPGGTLINVAHIVTMSPVG